MSYRPLDHETMIGIALYSAARKFPPGQTVSDEEAVAELRAVAEGRIDILAETAGIMLGAAPHGLMPGEQRAIRLMVAAGAHVEAIAPWAREGRDRVISSQRGPNLTEPEPIPDLAEILGPGFPIPEPSGPRGGWRYLSIHPLRKLTGPEHRRRKELAIGALYRAQDGLEDRDRYRHEDRDGYRTTIGIRGERGEARIREAIERIGETGILPEDAALTPF
ncbi:MAG TPA: hypothetical protein VL551_07865 [Actinospica sp.]|nr:hypothetical protein [Actinospica sp.]